MCKTDTIFCDTISSKLVKKINKCKSVGFNSADLMQVDVMYQYKLSLQLFFSCIEGFRLNKQLIFSKVGEIRWTGMICACVVNPVD